MPAKDGSGADSSQKLKPKVSKTKLKAADTGSERQPAASGRGLAAKPSGLKPKVSGTAPKVSGDTPKISGIKPKVSGVTPKASGIAPKSDATASRQSDRQWAAGAARGAEAKPESGAGSSTTLKVKKKKSSPEGKALNPKKSSLRKSSPVDSEPITPTDDLEPVNDEAEAADEIEDTTTAYNTPPGEADRDGATETYVLDTEKEGAEDKAADADEDDEADEEADADVAEEAEEKSDDQGSEEEEEAQEKSSSKSKTKATKSDEKTADRSKLSDRRRGRASKRDQAAGDGANGEATAQERSSKRSAAQKKAERAKVKIFLVFAIGSLVGLILIPIVMWWKGIWPFEGNRPKEEAIVYPVPAYPGETFSTLTQEFTAEANPEALLTEKNPKLPLDQPFTEKVKVVIGIPKSWEFRPTSDTSFIQHFLAKAQAAVEKDPPDVGKANQSMLLARKMLDRFVLKGESTAITKADWQSKLDDVQDMVTRAEGGTPQPRTRPPTATGGNNGGNSGTPPPPTPPVDTGPPPPSREEQLQQAKEKVAPIYANLVQIRALLGDNKEEALKLMKTTLTQLDDLHSIDPSQLLLKPVDDLLSKEADLQALFDKGQGATVEDFDAVKFPTLAP